jgi:hypothetical protein
MVVIFVYGLYINDLFLDENYYGRLYRGLCLLWDLSLGPRTLSHTQGNNAYSHGILLIILEEVLE